MGYFSCIAVSNVFEHDTLKAWSQGNDHRFTAAFLPILKIPSLSRSFNYQSYDNWVAKLQEVFDHAWTVWTVQLSDTSRFRLESGQISAIPEDVLQGLAEVISQLPPAKKYQKK